MTAFQFIGSLNDTGTGGALLAIVILFLLFRFFYNPEWRERNKQRKNSIHKIKAKHKLWKL